MSTTCGPTESDHLTFNGTSTSIISDDVTFGDNHSQSQSQIQSQNHDQVQYQHSQSLEFEMVSVQTVSSLKQSSRSEQQRHVKEAVVIILHASYLISGPGLCRAALMMISFVAFILVSMFGDKTHHYLATEVAWKFRVYIFVAVFCCLSCAAVIFLNLTSLHTMFRFDWNLIDRFHYVAFALANLFSSSVLATTQADRALPVSSREKAIIATCWGYACMLVSLANAFFAFRWRQKKKQQKKNSDASTTPKQQSMQQS